MLSAGGGAVRTNKGVRMNEENDRKLRVASIVALAAGLLAVAVWVIAIVRAVDMGSLLDLGPEFELGLVEGIMGWLVNWGGFLLVLAVLALLAAVCGLLRSRTAAIVFSALGLLGSLLCLALAMPNGGMVLLLATVVLAAASAYFLYVATKAK